MTSAQLAARIQHTLISAGATREDMVAHAREAVRYGFQAAMVAGAWVEVVAAELDGSGVEVASAVDFPVVGAMSSAGKAFEAERLVAAGARQIDTGVRIGALKSGMYDGFRDDIAGVVRAAGVPVKVMLELPLLSPRERDTAVDLAMEAGAAYLKNASSGRVGAATPESIAYLAGRVRNGVRVKASGSIDSRARAVELIAAGADLLGTSSGVSIVGDPGTDPDGSGY